MDQSSAVRLCLVFLFTLQLFSVCFGPFSHCIEMFKNTVCVQPPHHTVATHHTIDVCTVQHCISHHLAENAFANPCNCLCVTVPCELAVQRLTMIGEICQSSCKHRRRCWRPTRAGADDLLAVDVTKQVVLIKPGAVGGHGDRHVAVPAVIDFIVGVGIWWHTDRLEVKLRKHSDQFFRPPTVHDAKAKNTINFA